MDPRFVTRKMHAFLDYPVAFGLIALPFVLDLGASNPLAKWLAVATGVAALLLTILTDHETGIFRILPYWFHLNVDRLVGVTFVIAPFVFGFTGIDALFYWINGGAVLLVTTLHKSEGRSLAHAMV